MGNAAYNKMPDFHVSFFPHKPERPERKIRFRLSCKCPMLFPICDPFWKGTPDIPALFETDCFC